MTTASASIRSQSSLGMRRGRERRVLALGALSRLQEPPWIEAQAIRDPLDGLEGEIPLAAARIASRSWGFTSVGRGIESSLASGSLVGCRVGRRAVVP